MVLNSYTLHKGKTGQIIEMYRKSRAPRGRPTGDDSPIQLIGRRFSTLMPTRSGLLKYY